MLSLVTPPSGRVLTVAECRRQLRLGTSAGEPAPAAPSVALASPAAAGNCNNGDWRIGFTHVTADGETDLGPLSAAVTVADKTVNGQIAVTNIALGGSAVTARNAYALAPGETVAKYVGQIANNTATTLTVNIAVSSLGVQAPTTNTTEDPEILRWIDAAAIRGQRVSRRAFLTQTWDLVLDRFPSSDVIEIPKPPLQSITHVKYYDTAGVLQTWAASNYVVEAPAGDFAQHGRLSLAYGITWPSLYVRRAAVQVRFVAGYGAASAVPQLLKQGMLLDVATRSAQRENVQAGTASVVPGTADDIFRTFRVYQSQRRAA